MSVARPLVLVIDDGKVEISSPTVPGRLRVDASAAARLCAASVTSDLSDLPHALVEGLLHVGLAHSGDRHGSDQPRSLPAPFDVWGPLAWAFHRRTCDVHFIERGSDAMEHWHDQMDADPRPEPTQLERLARTGAAIWLPRCDRSISMPLDEVLRYRRTHRRFTDQPVALETFATLLKYTLGPQKFIDARELGVLELRSYVSGGARHETLGCVAAMNISGLDPGWYVYDGLRHALVPLDLDVCRKDLNGWTGRQGFYDSTAFGIITIADTTKMSWKYRSPRAYRHMLQNVGAYAQVFSMACHALGLGAAITGALSDSRFNELFTLQSPREMPMFSLCAGYPELADDGNPADMKVHGRPATSFAVLDRSRRI